MNNSKNILLVEDNKIVQLATCIILRDFACRIDTAETGTKALELCNNTCYDLIFMDIGLPVMNGSIVAKEIRKTSLHNKRTPIIALSAHSAEDVKKQCFESGIDDYLEKPLTDEKIRIMFNKFLNSHYINAR